MIDFRIKDLFFDRGTVLRALDSAKRRVLSQGGAFIRTTAKHSIRTKKGPAPPGSRERRLKSAAPGGSPAVG